MSSRIDDDACVDEVARHISRQLEQVLAKLDAMGTRLTRVESRIVHMMVRSGLFTKTEAKSAPLGTVQATETPAGMDYAEAALERMKRQRELGYPMK